MTRNKLAFLPLLFALTGVFLSTVTFAADETRWASEFSITRENFNNPLVLIDTNMGEIVVELFPEEAPQTVANFLGLAEGTKAFTDPYALEANTAPEINTFSGSDPTLNSGLNLDSEVDTQVMRPFFDGLVFHRVIDGFMIQTGSPTGLADGDPGYVFRNEINGRNLGLDKILAIDENGVPHPYLGVSNQRELQQRVLAPLYREMGITSNEQLQERVDEVYTTIHSLTVLEVNQKLGYEYNERYLSRMPLAGVLVMANAGPHTNGSQFFITLVDTPWLTGKFTVFGKVRVGMDVAERIGKVRVDAEDRPVQHIIIKSVRRLQD